MGNAKTLGEDPEAYDRRPAVVAPAPRQTTRPATPRDQGRLRQDQVNPRVDEQRAVESMVRPPSQMATVLRWMVSDTSESGTWLPSPA